MNNLLIFTAPPASGKTYFIGNFLTHLNQIPLVICPLRALADECCAKWGEDCVVMTPEEWLRKKNRSKIVIFDEFHLYFYWGDSFRHSMWEAFYELVMDAELVIFLTATISDPMLEEIKNFSVHFDEIIWIDHGNQKLKNHPAHYYQAPSLNWMRKLVLYNDWQKGNLIFCAFRKEVLQWESQLLARGYSVWTCLGGEASAFSKKVMSQDPPDFIIATTVLSHGVNLPNINRIFFTYQIKNHDFWIQMVARGGRKGEKFEVYALEKPLGIKWNFWFNCLAILGLNLKIEWNKFYRQIQEWFLKA